MERSDSILRNSLFVIRYSAVRCLIQAIVTGSLIIMKLCHFGVVSYEVSETEAGSQMPDTGRNELEIPRSRGCHFGFWIQELS